MKTNFSPGLTKLWQNWPTSRRLETRKKTRRTTAPGRRAAKEKAKENRCLQLLPRNTRNPAAAAVKLQKCNYKTLFGLHTHTHTHKSMRMRRVPFPSYEEKRKNNKNNKNNKKKKERERESPARAGKEEGLTVKRLHHTDSHRMSLILLPMGKRSMMSVLLCACKMGGSLRDAYRKRETERLREWANIREESTERFVPGNKAKKPWNSGQAVRTVKFRWHEPEVIVAHSKETC